MRFNCTCIAQTISVAVMLEHSWSYLDPIGLLQTDV